MHPMLTIACRAANAAGAIIQRGFQELERIPIVEKGRGDLVSMIDKQAEMAILRVLQDKYPHHQYLCEETGAQESDNEYQWIIDPLNGTANFLRNIPHFAVSIALLKKGIPEIALVYNPVREDWYLAEKGAGARMNKQRIRVSNNKDASKALFATGLPYKSPALTATHFRRINATLNVAADMRCSGSAALDLCAVASAQVDAYFEPHVAAWDIAAGMLIAQEAGAIISDLNGKKTMLESGEILCATPHMHALLLKEWQNLEADD